MTNKYKENIISGYTNNLLAIDERNVKSLTALGYVTTNYENSLFHMLIECMKHIEIFNEEQTTNITNMINKVSLYG